MADAYRVVGPAYWVGVLDVACTRWRQPVAKPRRFGQNADARLTGEAIVALAVEEIVKYGYVGRAGGSTGSIIIDVEMDAWRRRLYEVRRDPLPANRNWMPIAEFVALVTSAL